MFHKKGTRKKHNRRELVQYQLALTTCFHMLTKACNLYRYKEQGSYKYKEQGSQEVFIMFHHHSCIGLLTQKKQ
jgi:hypothetical protein